MKKGSQELIFNAIIGEVNKIELLAYTQGKMNKEEKRKEWEEQQSEISERKQKIKKLLNML